MHRVRELGGDGLRPRSRLSRIGPFRAHPQLVASLVLGLVGLVPVVTGMTSLSGDPSSATDPALVTDAGAGPLVTVAALAPGRPATRCLQLGYSSAVAGDQLKLVASNEGGVLADYLDVRVESGTGGRSGDCTGFRGVPVFSGTLGQLGATHGTAQDALPLSALPSGNGSVSVRLRFSVRSDNRAQGTAASTDLVWMLDATGQRTSPPPVETPVDPPIPSEAPTPVPTVPRPPTEAPEQPAVPPVDVPPVPVPAEPPTPPVEALDPGPEVTVPRATEPQATAPQATEPQATEPQATAPQTPQPRTTAATPGPAAPTPGPEPVATEPEPTSPAAGISGDGDGGGPAERNVLSRGVSAVVDAVGAVLEPIREAALPAAKGAGYSLFALPLLILFLLVQKRIDAQDPKLALAPSYADPDLAFDEIPRGPLRGEPLL